jgi:hypothetical protein
MNNKTYLLFFLCFFFSSCHQTSCWNNNYILSQNDQSNTSSLIYRNSQNFLEIEFLQFNNEISCFLNVFPTDISHTGKDILVSLSTISAFLETNGYIRDGNQKIALNDEAKNFLVKALSENQTVTVKIEDIQENIVPEFFSQKYKKLLNYNSFYTKLLKSFY